MNKERIAIIHDFWFGTLDEEGKASPEKSKSWWQKDAAFDDQIKEKFENDVQNAIIGEYASWLETADGRLACIILIDQFCRNIYRDTANAFAHDHLTQAWTLDGLKHGHDKTLPHVKRTFFYLPLMHTEDLTLQDLSLKCYREAADDAPFALREMLESNYDFAVKHKVIIERFGRFPHRNAILGRESSNEELEFLKQPGSSF